MGWSSSVMLVVRGVYHIIYIYIHVSFPIMIEERKCTNKNGSLHGDDESSLQLDMMTLG